MNEYELTEKETNDLIADLIHKNESDELLKILNIRINDDTKKGYIEKYKCILPKRDDEKYLRIEQYANYEFTHCITYEMAIRNENVIKLSKLRDMLIILNNNNNNNNLTKEISHEEISHEEITIGGYKATCSHYKVTQRSTSNFINNINLEVLQNKYKEKNPLKFFNQISTKHKKEILNWLIEKVDEELDEKYLVIDDETYKSLSSDIYNHKINTVGNNSYLTNNIKDEHYKGFQGKSENSNKFNINKTIATFSQPLRIFNTMEISINPSLPLNDILSFVKRIKKDYDTKNSFKSFFELTIEDLIIDSDRKNTIGNAISYNKKKWADIFYIFDYFQFYLSKNNKINKGKTRNKEAEETTIAKEISLQLSYYHILEEKTSLDFSESVDIGIQNSIYDMYDVDFQEKIKEQIRNNPNCSLLNYVKLPKEIEKEISDKITAEIEKEIKDQIIAEKENKPLKEIIRDMAKYRKERIQKALNNKKEEELQNTSMAYYITANHIRTDSYPRIKKLIQGNSPEYIKFVNGKNHDLDSFIDGENNTSSKLQ